jgi:hypothetical protein
MALCWAFHPPSIGMVVPVMLCASGAQSHTANLAMSAGDESQCDPFAYPTLRTAPFNRSLHRLELPGVIREPLLDVRVCL